MSDKNELSSVLIPIVTSGISFISGLFVAYFSNWIGQRNKLNEKRENHIDNILHQFYGPLCALLEENSRIYNEFGPSRFHGLSVETANSRGETWNSLKETVVIPNLKVIRSLIHSYWIIVDVPSKKHLQDLLMHCIAFTEYDKAPNEMYSRFKYNKEWIIKVKEDIKTIRS